MDEHTHERELTFIDHLEELRRRIIYSVAAIVLCTLIGFAFANPMLEFLTRPFKKNITPERYTDVRILVEKDGSLRLAEQPGEKKGTPNTALRKASRLILEFEGAEPGDQREIILGGDLKEQFYYFSPIDPFLLRMKAALLVGILLALPIILWQVWLFVKPALTGTERHAIIPVSLAALILFPVGAGFAWFFTRYALLFLSKYAFAGLEPRLNIFKYLNFLLTMMVALGLIFETPLVLMLLARIGIVNSHDLSRFRLQIYVGIFIVAAFLTPPDVFTMIALSIPLITLFEASIWLIKPIERKRLRS